MGKTSALIIMIVLLTGCATEGSVLKKSLGPISYIHKYGSKPKVEIESDNIKAKFITSGWDVEGITFIYETEF